MPWWIIKNKKTHPQNISSILDWRGPRRIHSGWFGWRWCHVAGCLGSGELCITAFCDSKDNLFLIAWFVRWEEQSSWQNGSCFVFFKLYKKELYFLSCRMCWCSHMPLNFQACETTAGTSYLNQWRLQEYKPQQCSGKVLNSVLDIITKIY